MRNIIYTCFNKQDSMYIDGLHILLEENKSYKKNHKVDNLLSDTEIRYIKDIINSYDVSKNPQKTMSQDMFEMEHVETKGAFEDCIQIPVNDFRTYIYQFIDKRANQYCSDLLLELNKKLKNEGATQEVVEGFARIEAISNRNKARDIDIDIHAQKEYDNMKLRPNGLQTGIKEVDNRIGGMNVGTVSTIAAFTSSFKCVSENERIYTNRGLLTIKEIYEIGVGKGLKVQSEYGMRDVTNVHDEGEKESYIIYINGVPIETSPVHRFRVLTNEGLLWKQAKDICIGDKVVQSLKECTHEGKNDDKDFWRLYGQILGDGGVTGNTVYVGGAVEKIKSNDTENLFSKYFKSYSVTDIKGRKDGYLQQKLIRASLNNALRLEFKDFIGKKARTKTFPTKLFHLSKECWISFIKGYYETDGISNKDLGFSSCNKDILYNLSRLLSAIGISSSILYIRDTDSYRLYIKGNYSKNKFMSIVKDVKSKAYSFRHFNELLDHASGFPTRLAYEGCKKPHYTVQDYKFFGTFGDKHRSCNFNKIKLVCEKYEEFNNSDYFREILNAELTWGNVTKIEKSHCYMYDLTVEGSHTYLINGYVTHNTTFALNIARLNSYYLGYNIAYLSLETPKLDMYWNLLSCHSYEPKFPKYNFVSHDKIRHCKMTKGEEDFIFNEVAKDLKEDYLGDDGKMHKRGKIVFLDESDFNTFSFGEISAVLEKVDDKLDHKLDAVIVDYVQLCKFSGSSGISTDVNNQINAYVTFFRRLAQNFRKEVDSEGKEHVRQLTMILLAQVNRTSWQKANRNEGRYDITCLADANELERGSYRVFTVYTTEDLKARKSAQVQILKNRTGQTMYDPVTVYADGEAYVFMDEDGMNQSIGMSDGTATMDSVLGGLGDDDLSSLGI